MSRQHLLLASILPATCPMSHCLTTDRDQWPPSSRAGMSVPLTEMSESHPGRWIANRLAPLVQRTCAGHLPGQVPGHAPRHGALSACRPADSDSGAPRVLPWVPQAGRSEGRCISDADRSPVDDMCRENGVHVAQRPAKTYGRQRRSDSGDYAAR